MRAVFEDGFASGAEVGASVCVTVDGETVVDLWGGFADADRTRPWQRDTIINVYSVTKTLTALTALLVADRGEIDVAAPVSRYWPEFAANGKEYDVDKGMWLEQRWTWPGREINCRCVSRSIIPGLSKIFISGFAQKVIVKLLVTSLYNFRRCEVEDFVVRTISLSFSTECRRVEEVDERNTTNTEPYGSNRTGRRTWLSPIS